MEQLLHYFRNSFNIIQFRHSNNIGTSCGMTTTTFANQFNNSYISGYEFLENILISNCYSSDDLITLHRSIISYSRNVTFDNVNGRTLDFEDVTINGNGGTLTGAVKYSQHPGTVYLRNCLFTSFVTSSTAYGLIMYDAASYYMYLYNVAFENNNANSIYVLISVESSYGKICIKDSIFRNNKDFAAMVQCCDNYNAIIKNTIFE